MGVVSQSTLGGRETQAVRGGAGPLMDGGWRAGGRSDNGQESTVNSQQCLRVAVGWVAIASRARTERCQASGSIQLA